MNKQTDKEKGKTQRTKRAQFPESNRFWAQMRILLAAQLPLIGTMARELRLKICGGLHDFIAKVRIFTERKRIPAPVFLAVAALIAVPAIFFSLFTWGTTVAYNGQELGTVSTSTEALTAVNQVEEELTGVLGDSFTLDESLVSYSSGLVSRRSMMDTEKLETNLNDELNLTSYAYSLYVDGEFIGANKSKEALEALLDQIKAPYLNENTQSIEFLEDVEIREGYVATEDLSNLGDIVLKLNETKTGEVIYTVQAGDVWGRIANNYGMTTSELAALNPGFDINKIQIGDEILISNAVPYLTVKVTQYEYYEAEIPYDIEYVDDPNMWEGDTSVVSKGVYGKADTTALVTYVNSEEIERTITEQVVTSEPVNEVQKRGTAKRPSWAPTGSFRWPTNGNITSRYGYRTIFGGSDFHGGIDIANRTGTDIVAADGGVVTYAGWNGSYGYLIVIDHQNGYETYYAHNSKLLVSVGTKVFKGQHIAEMGSTGRVTGSHCHFEVRYGGERKNPLNYLP